MTDALDIALAQLNMTVGDIAGNAARIRSVRKDAAEAGAHLVMTTELALCGYPPEDLVVKPAFLDEVEATARDMAAETSDGGPAILLGLPWRHGGKVHNAVALLADGAIKALIYKHDLPNYGVFDEPRVFRPGALPEPVELHGIKLGIMICEDMWTPEAAKHLKAKGAEVLLVPNGSPFEMGKEGTRLSLAAERVSETGLPLLYVNQVGGQDELVFDGASFGVNYDGKLAIRLDAWQESVSIAELRRHPNGRLACEAGVFAPQREGLRAIYGAMTLGLKDYVRKNRFPGVLIGLSGGIDSALTAAVAVDALGSENVRVVMMPSRYTSQASLDDAAACAERLGIAIDTVEIEPAVAAFDSMLKDVFANTQPDTAEENIQARIRGVILMAMSNKFGHMLVTTGNKSELSVGYATLYGDMSGGYSVLKDVYKTTVVELAHWRNGHKLDWALGPDGEVIPLNIITKPPSAELRANQTDQDSLPPYDVLDAILEGLVEKELPVDEIVSQGYDRDIVARIEHMLYVAEYKRRQAPPGVKITRRNFGRDRRYPITNGFRDARRRI
jgi:NAD+ synthase